MDAGNIFGFGMKNDALQVGSFSKNWTNELQ